MKNTTWLVSVVFAFGLGYFFHAASVKGNLPKSEVVAAATTGLPAISLPVTSVKCEATSSRSSSSASSIPVTAPVALEMNEPGSLPSAAMPEMRSSAPASSSVAELSDAEIDKILPAPFNAVIKGNHGNDRDIYKKFSQASEPKDWDISMQNKLSDAILSSPYANALSIDSILCKGDICEVRIVEYKDGVWALLMAEMRMQTWWDFGANSSYGFAFVQDSKLLTGNLALFVRKENYRAPQ